MISKNSILFVLFSITTLIAPENHTLFAEENRLKSEEQRLSDIELAEEISRMEQKIRLYRFRAKEQERNAQRLWPIDLGESRHLYRHSQWLRQRAIEMEEQLGRLKETQRLRQQ